MAITKYRLVDPDDGSRVRRVDPSRHVVSMVTGFVEHYPFVPAIFDRIGFDVPVAIAPDFASNAALRGRSAAIDMARDLGLPYMEDIEDIYPDF